MKIFIKQSTIYTDKNVKDFDIVCLSDLHHTKSLTLDKLKEITEQIIYLKPKYICFLGDTNDDKSSYQEIIDWFNILAKIAPVYFVLGNHDIEKYKINDKMYKVSSALPKKVIEELENINNLKILRDNNVDICDGVTFCGTNFYDESNYENAIKYLNKNIPDFESKTFNIMLSHNPMIINPLIFDKLCEEYKFYVDCIISGHTHNGLFTPNLDKILPGTRGFYIKSQGLFPKYTRGEFDASESEKCLHGTYKGIICPPIRTLPDRNIILRKANDIIYNPGIQLVRVKKIKWKED